MPTFGSLFAGIGGIDLGLERAGWTGRWQVEWDSYCQHVLAHHWPDVPRYGDITRVDWSTVEPVDLIAGGFPCQPISIAGKQAAQDDVRWLWPEFARAVSVLRPRYVLVENVRNLLAVNGGRALGEVLGDLDTLGYHTERHVVSAADVGAPHLRQRLWIVGRAEQSGALADAHDGGPRHAVRAGRDAVGDGRATVADADGPGRGVERLDLSADGYAPPWHDADGRRGALADAESIRGGALGPAGDGTRWADRTVRGGAEVPDSDRRGTQGLVSERDDAPERTGPDERPSGLLRGAGRDRQWEVEPDVGRVAHGVPARVDRLRALGNAVVPQVVEVIGRRILDVMAQERRP